MQQEEEEERWLYCNWWDCFVSCGELEGKTKGLYRIQRDEKGWVIDGLVVFVGFGVVGSDCNFGVMEG